MHRTPLNPLKFGTNGIFLLYLFGSTSCRQNFCWQRRHMVVELVLLKEFLGEVLDGSTPGNSNSQNDNITKLETRKYLKWVNLCNSCCWDEPWGRWSGKIYFCFLEGPWSVIAQQETVFQAPSAEQEPPSCRVSKTGWKVWKSGRPTDQFLKFSPEMSDAQQHRCCLAPVAEKTICPIAKLLKLPKGSEMIRE